MTKYSQAVNVGKPLGLQLSHALGCVTKKVSPPEGVPKRCSNHHWLGMEDLLVTSEESWFQM